MYIIQKRLSKKAASFYFKIEEGVPLSGHQEIQIPGAKMPNRKHSDAQLVSISSFR